MRLSGYTSTDDWHPLTLLAMARDRRCWGCIFDWKGHWIWGFSYHWWDGPLFQFGFGPICVSVTYLNYPAEEPQP